MKYLIAGLGNVGPEYELTRHNIGFLTLDRLADKNSFPFAMERFAYFAEYKYKGKNIYFIKPTTYMNLSGRAVYYWLQYLKISIENLLVICDDVNLPYGSLRLRSKGSSGGQNGLNNINEVLGTDNYARLRMGIGNDYPKGGQVDYVLGRFSKQQFETLPEVMDKAGEAVLSFVTEGITLAMNKFNN